MMAVSNKNMCLWWGSGSPPCFKVMIVLAEKGLFDKCQKKLIEFSKKEHKSEEVLKINPRGQMPTFVDEGVVINESNAICMHLEEKYKDNCLIPADISLRAQVYQYMFEADNVKANIIEPILFYKMKTKEEDWDQALLKERVTTAETELERWNTSIAGKDYLVGGKFTMADVFLYTYLAICERQSCNFSKYPALQNYLKCVGGRASVVMSKPPHWETGPVPTNLKEVGA